MIGSVCVVAGLGVRMGGCVEACMRWIRACNSACVSDCIMAVCMTMSNDGGIPPRWL